MDILHGVGKSGSHGDLQDLSNHASRNDFIMLVDVRRIEKLIEAEEIRLNRDDGQSILAWTCRLQAHGHLLGFKSVLDPPPTISGLKGDTFFLAIQTDWQRDRLSKHDSSVIYIDGTHNTTMYEGVTLTTLLVCDKWGHGTLRNQLDIVDQVF